MSEILEQKKIEFIENTEKFKELIETTLRNRLNECGYIDIYNDNGISFTVYANDFEIEAEEHLQEYIEDEDFVYKGHSHVSIIFKNIFGKVAEFDIYNEKQLYIVDNVLMNFQDR